MPVFNYKAKDKSGNTVNGTVDALDKHSAAGKVREMGHLPMDIRPARGKADRSTPKPAGSVLARYLIHPFYTGVSLRTLTFFFRQLATLLGAGMTLSEALGSAGSRASGRLRCIIDEAQATVQGGGQLSGVLQRHPQVFNRMVRELMRVGEAGGLLEEMTDRIASYLEYELSIRRMLAKTAFYPFLIFLAIIIIPRFPILVLHGPSAFAQAMLAYLRQWLPHLVIALVVLKILFQSEDVRFVWDSIKIRLPVLGAMAAKIAMSRFSRALAVLYSAGVSMSESVSVAADASSNIAVARLVKRAVPAIQRGGSLTESLAKTGAVTPMVLDMLSTGEKTGSMDSVLNKVADYMDEEVDATIHKLGILMFVGAILIAGVIVARIVLEGYMSYAGGLGL